MEGYDRSLTAHTGLHPFFSGEEAIPMRRGSIQTPYLHPSGLFSFFGEGSIPRDASAFDDVCDFFMAQ